MKYERPLVPRAKASARLPFAINTPLIVRFVPSFVPSNDSFSWAVYADCLIKKAPYLKVPDALESSAMFTFKKLPFCTEDDAVIVQL